jgi:hypothetical protein
VQVCVGDLPNLVKYERVANQVKVEELRKVFTEAVSEWGDNANFGFNPELKY